MMVGFPLTYIEALKTSACLAWDLPMAILSSVNLSLVSQVSHDLDD